MTNRRAIIVGGSIGGLFAARALLNRGWQVDVYERNNTALAGRGAGIVTHDRLLAAMRAVGLDPGDDLGVPIAVRRLYDRDGTVLRELPFQQISTSWERLFQSLRGAVPDSCYHLGQALVGATTDDDSAKATLCDGTTIKADLIIAADGIRSSVRAALWPAAVPAYAGYVGWRGLVDEADLPVAHRHALMETFAFCMPPGEQFLAYPIAGANRGRRYNFVWYRPANAATVLPRLLTDRAGRRHESAVPPPLVSPEVIDDLLQAARIHLWSPLADAVSATSMPFFQPIYDLEPPSLVQGRVVLIGDAASVARPHVGAGVTKAAEDAVALAAALDTGDIGTGLVHFDATRRPASRRLVQRGRSLGANLDGRDPAGPDVVVATASLHNV